MRFQNGSKVEVLRKSEVPPGSWHCAEVICGNVVVNGDYCTVRYTGAGSGNVVERVSRNAVRPCPPLSEFSETLGPGDVVEVFDGDSWKIAIVSKVLRKNRFMVRLLGFSFEFKVGRTDIRVRQSWEHNKWVMIGKGSAYCDYVRHYESLCNLSSRVQTKADCFFPVENKITLQSSRFGSSAYENFQLEDYAKAVGPRRKMAGDNFIRVFSNNPNNADTMTCSVGSCSITGSNAYDQLPHEDLGSLSDAESCCQRGHEEGNHPLQSAEIHELELYAYRRTIGALHACGPLSWEQEALVTNLRLLLNISNDEHLMEIKSLISAGKENV